MVSEIAFFVILAVKVFAFVDALTRPTQAYVAAGKLTKPAWLLILGLTVATALLWPSVIGILSIVGIVAAFVFLLDVRLALASVTAAAEIPCGQWLQASQSRHARRVDLDEMLEQLGGVVIRRQLDTICSQLRAVDAGELVEDRARPLTPDPVGGRRTWWARSLAGAVVQRGARTRGGEELPPREPVCDRAVLDRKVSPAGPLAPLLHHREVLDGLATTPEQTVLDLAGTCCSTRRCPSLNQPSQASEGDADPGRRAKPRHRDAHGSWASSRLVDALGRRSFESVVCGISLEFVLDLVGRGRTILVTGGWTSTNESLLVVEVRLVHLPLERGAVVKDVERTTLPRSTGWRSAVRLGPRDAAAGLRPGHVPEWLAAWSVTGGLAVVAAALWSA